MGLDDYPPDSSEPLSSRFWRRYGQNAFSLLESIRREPSMAEVLIEANIRAVRSGSPALRDGHEA